ncbi:hypothetical protein [Chryseobacterium sp. YR221]|uniref:hypothetical protein n=1 Tax=Chryseobacterium sp. YR221 TaxID=1500293 RepID=UPI0009D86C5D|nr:hypothetical protein [Chryseobacterium sp. YR221]SMC86891.1 hypothetical protein SAMN02787074_3503 [Chryseobacterium sp. YR221]
MKTIIIFSFLFIPFSFKAQIEIIDNYDAMEVFQEADITKDLFYSWIKNGEYYYMNFPISVTGLQNLKDKAEYIAQLSNMDDYTWDKSVVSDHYRNEENPYTIFQAIRNGTIIINVGYIIGDKEMICLGNSSSFKLYIRNRTD